MSEQPMVEQVTIGNATLYLGDCLQVLTELHSAGRLAWVNHIITDPPFDADAHTAQRRVLGRGVTACRDLENQALPFAPLRPEQRDGIASWAAQYCHGWFVGFCQTEAVGTWRAALEGAGARWRRAGIWVKPDGSPQLSGDRPAQGHEAIAIAWCGPGRSVWNGGGKSAVFTFCKHDTGTGHGGASKDHPAQKPRALMDQIVSLFSEPDALVLDPFMGSGSTGISCLGLGRRFIGIESNPEYFTLACRRIEAAHAQQRLFA